MNMIPYPCYEYTHSKQVHDPSFHCDIVVVARIMLLFLVNIHVYQFMYQFFSSSNNRCLLKRQSYIFSFLIIDVYRLVINNCV